MNGFCRGGLGGFLALALTVVSTKTAAEERFALVRTWADLYVAPSADAPRLNPYADAERARGREEAVVYRLAGERDGWLELETVPAAERSGHCAGGLRALASLRLRVFARAEARVHVTARPVRVEWPDGTAVELAPGVPLYGRAEDVWRADLGAVGVELALPREAVGHDYAPGAPFGRAETGAAFVEDAAVRAGALRLKQGRLRAATDLPVPLLFAREARRDGEDVVANFDLGCGRVSARVTPGLLRAEKDLLPEKSVAGAVAEVPGHLRVLAGATAFWPDGRVAGRVEAPTPFHREVASALPHLRCLQKPLRWVRRGERRIDRRNRLVLCFEPPAVVR